LLDVVAATIGFLYILKVVGKYKTGKNYAKNVLKCFKGFEYNEVFLLEIVIILLD